MQPPSNRAWGLYVLKEKFDLFYFFCYIVFMPITPKESKASYGAGVFQ